MKEIKTTKLRLLEDCNLGKKGKIVFTTKEDAIPYVTFLHKAVYVPKDDELEKEGEDDTLDRYIVDPETKEQDKKKEEKKPNDDNPIEKEVMEPVIYEGKPWWLVVKKKVACYDDGKSLEDVVEKEKEGVTEKSVETVFELREQGLWKCVKCAKVVQSIIGKPVKCSDTKCGSTDFTLLTKVINLNRWKLPVWEDLPAEELDTKKVYDGMLACISKEVCDIPRVHTLQTFCVMDYKYLENRMLGFGWFSDIPRGIQYW